MRDPDVRERIEELAIPPAWQDVWICPYPMGHIQATGVDAAGRKQYRYHDRWRQRQDAAKFDEMLGFARSLPRVRASVERDLAREEMDRARVLACALRLLDRGFFRIGSESYAEENETYGLATMKKGHVQVDGERVRFDYAAKGKQQRVESFVDPSVAEVVEQLKRRRGGSDELLAYKDGGRWQDVKSQDINEYLKEITGADFSAKDFRTWSATVLAAWFLALAGPTTAAKTARKRVQARVVKEVAKHLGNTPGGVPLLLHRPAGLRSPRRRGHDRGARRSCSRRWTGTGPRSSPPSRRRRSTSSRTRRPSPRWLDVR